MAMGETIGYCARTTQNNSATYFSSYGARFITIGLMGDPTLRNDIIAPVQKVVLANEGYDVKINWEPSTDEVMGYHVYRRILSEGEDFVRINDSLITTVEYRDSCLTYEGDITYMVRAMNLQQTPSGSYFNMSHGTAATVNHIGTPDLTADATFDQEGQMVTFANASTGSIEHYLWLFGDGETSEDENPVHEYEDGLFEATLIISNACRSDTISMEILILTGTKDIEDDAAVTISPNPSDGKFSVLMKEDFQTPIHVYLYASDGSLVFEKEEVAPNESLSLTALGAGVYTLLITQNNQQFRKRLVLIR
jgi:hypothetical protein